MTEYGMLFYLTTKKIVFPACVFLKGGRKPGVEVREVELSSEGWLMGRFYYAALYLGKNMAEDRVDRPHLLAPALAAMMPCRQWDKVEHKLRCLGRIEIRLDDIASRGEGTHILEHDSKSITVDLDVLVHFDDIKP